MPDPITSSIHFVFPGSFLDERLPKKTSDDWSFLSASSQPTIYYLFLLLKEHQYQVTASSKIRKKSINIGHPIALASLCFSDFLESYIVCWQQDYPRCHLAHRHIVMNRSELSIQSLSPIDRFLFPGPRDLLHYIPEPSLKQRNTDRGSQFEIIGYFGNPKNLLGMLLTTEWTDRLNRQGIKFVIKDSRRASNDYSEVDCVIAIRPSYFSSKQKSAHKLWNAWRAGVPAILGNEPGFRDYKFSELDYIEATNADEAYEAIVKLKSNPELVKKIVGNGLNRSAEVTQTALLEDWIYYINYTLEPACKNWINRNVFIKYWCLLLRTTRIFLSKAREFLVARRT